VFSGASLASISCQPQLVARAGNVRVVGAERFLAPLAVWGSPEKVEHASAPMQERVEAAAGVKHAAPP